MAVAFGLGLSECSEDGANFVGPMDDVLGLSIDMPC